jgi:thioredoxin reductase (NADPH)
MSMAATHEVIVIGGGVAGAACALRAAQYNMRTAWVLGDREAARRSRARWVSNVDNMIGVHSGIVLDSLRAVWKSRPDLLKALDDLPHIHIGTREIVENVRSRLREFGPLVTVIEASARHASRTAEGFEVETGDPSHASLRATALVLATGVMDRQPSIARETAGGLRDGIHWIYPYANRETVLYCVRCEGHLTHRKISAIIGVSETAAQIALMLAERYDSACCLLANGEPRAIEARTMKLLERHRIAIHDARIVEVIGDPAAGKPGTLHGFRLEDGTEVMVDFAFVSLGLHRVYNDLAIELGAALHEEEGPDERRHVRIDSRGETSVRGLFAVGDMAMRPDEPVMKQIYTAQEYAVRAVDVIDRRRREAMRRSILNEGEETP